MSKNVFANGNEISAKKDGNKSIAAMPDVCLTPPPPPAGPIPIPYPNFSEASDTADGSKTVKVGGDEAGLKNKSNYKASKGDEAATKAQGMGVVTHQIQGKTFHAAWSMDVVFEGENVIRHLDMTTGNHASNPMNSGDTTVDMATMATLPPDPTCQELGDSNNNDRINLRGSGAEGKGIANGKTTITNAKITPPNGPSVQMKGCSRNVPTKFKNDFAPGLPPEQVAANNSNLCAKAKEKGFKYRGNNPKNCPQTSHTESRILETALANGQAPPGTKVVFNISWTTKNKRSGKPCSACQRLLCAAAACGIEIKICENGQQKDPPPAPDKTCDEKYPKGLG